MFNLKIKAETESFATEEYGTFGWPIKYFDKAQNLNEKYNYTTINLRIDDNTKPILFLENTDLLGQNNNSAFIDENTLLNGTAIDWSKDITLKFPNTGTGVKDNIPYYIKLQYFRQIDTDTTNFNGLFASIDTPNLGDIVNEFQQVSNQHYSFIEGVLPDGFSFSGVAVAGANFDSNRVVFHTRMQFPKKTTGEFYATINAEINEGFSLEGNFNQMSFLKKNIYNYVQSIQENANSEPIKILDIATYNGLPGREEDLYILGLMQSELLALKNVTGLSNHHARYIGFEDVSPYPAEDINGISYKKYKLNVQGLDDSGLAAVAYPSSDIFVFTSRGSVFSSKDFSNIEPTTPNQEGCGIKYRNDITCVKYGANYGPLYKGSIKLASFKKWDYLILNEKVTPEEKEIIIAMSENEGNMDSVQSYDSEILTVGAMQKTINSLGYGELSTQLGEFKKDYPEKFKNLFENCGWTIKESNNTYQAFYNKITGSNLKKLIRKGFEAKSYKNKVVCIPIEPFINACKDEYFQEKQVVDFIKRLYIAINKKPTGYTNKIADFVKSQLGKATVLDHDINRPSHVSDCFSDALKQFFLSNPEVSKNPINWNDNHDIYERKVLDIYGPLRGEGIYTMTDATKRYDNLKTKLT